MDIYYFVRTTGERKFDYSPLKTTSLYDYEHKPVESFIRQLKEISEYDSVLLEDDLCLCKNFQEEIEKVISEHPNSIIQFFTDITVWETSHMRNENFSWNQCTYYPKGVAANIAKVMEQQLPHYGTPQKLYSCVENKALITLNIPHYIHRPCLVQHMDIDSILQSPGFNNIRGTIYFKDYLDNLNIDYNDAYSYENKKRLTQQFIQHINSYKNKKEEN